eukprot:3528204-Rhodomonas_salina.2
MTFVSRLHHGLHHVCLAECDATGTTASSSRRRCHGALRRPPSAVSAPLPTTFSRPNPEP